MVSEPMTQPHRERTRMRNPPRLVASPLETHADPALRAQRDDRVEPDPLTANVAEAPALRERREHEDPLHPREALADAQPRAAAEREVRIARARRLRLRREALRDEALGLGEEPRVAVHERLADEDDR